MKHLLCRGKVVNGGMVEITVPTLEERLDAQIKRNAEILAMHRDLDAIIERERREPTSFRFNDMQLGELLDAIENDYTWIRRGC